MISAIVCVDSNWGIGYQGELLAHIPEDMKLFREITKGNIVAMGRKTWDSLPKKPLEKRMNCVITSKVDLIEYNRDDNYYLMTLDYAKDIFPILSRHGLLDIFVIGGGVIYKELLPYCDKIYITKILHGYDNVDTYFPNIDNLPEWEIESESKVKEHNDIKYQFCTYKKKEV